MAETLRLTIQRLILAALIAYWVRLPAQVSAAIFDGVSNGQGSSERLKQAGSDKEGASKKSYTSAKSEMVNITSLNAECARRYMDSLLADHNAARKQLCGNFTKRSNVAVFYTCFERLRLIHRALPSIFLSNGIRNFDVFISQDGISPSIFDDEVFSIPGDMPYVYIQHPVNLCTGLHMHFVKAFAFDIMGYDILLIVEEDNVLHPQALQLLARMAELSVNEPDVGVVSLLDMDMGPFLDSSRFSVGIVPVRSTTGHLWIFGLHRVKYDAIREMMNAYYDAIKGYEYRTKHLLPLRPRIEALMIKYGFPIPSPFSQDRFFLNSLATANFTKRYQTLFRFFQPIGSSGLHFKYNTSHFVKIFGQHMYNGLIDPSAAFDVTKDPRDIKAIRDSVRLRLNRLFQRYRRSFPLESLVNSTFYGIMEGRLNGQGVAHNIRGADKGSPPPPPPIATCDLRQSRGAI
ncbi:hypothetical protein VaNZ11_016862 [Volvox africanus]|uniref:Uncharacterized protein n=1 Tax=Volvox africanus TaxID=51714 RepID=A0ABQ5SNL9_9CHLO|nr:hypothetical protein VaNZ11_016862 [Volvox africanus]